MEISKLEMGFLTPQCTFRTHPRAPSLGRDSQVLGGNAHVDGWIPQKGRIDQQRPGRVLMGVTPGRESPGGHSTGVGKDVALSPVWDSLMNFALKVLQQNTLSPWSRNFIPVLNLSFQFGFLFLILASLTRYLISSAVIFKRPLFTFFLPTHFLSPLSSSNVTPFSYTIHTPARSPHLPLKGTKKHLLTLGSHARVLHLLEKSHPNSRDLGWSTPNPKQRLQGSQLSNPSRSPRQNTIFQLLISPLCWGSSRQGQEKGKHSLWKANACQIPDHFHSVAVPGFHAGKPATVFGREFEDPFPELLGLKFHKE